MNGLKDFDDSTRRWLDGLSIGKRVLLLVALGESLQRDGVEATWTLSHRGHPMFCSDPAAVPAADE